jgi:hypothetical protein
MKKIKILVICIATIAGIYANAEAVWQFNLYARVATPGSAQSVATYNNYAFVADADSGLAIFNMTSPAYPIYAGSYKHGDFVQEIIVDDHFAYLANWSRGVKILNITNPSSPDSIGALNTSGMTSDLCLRGNLLYAADLYNGVVILDISDKAHPRQVGHITTTGYAYAVEVFSDSVIYIADQGVGLQTYTLGDTLNPTQRNSRLLVGDCMDVAIKDSFLYVACGTSGMVVFGLTNPLSPDSIKTYDTPGYLNQIIFADTFAFLSDEASGIYAYSVSSPGNPVLVGEWNTPGAARGMAWLYPFALVADVDTLFVVAPWFPNAIDDNDVSLPENIKLNGCYPNPFNPSAKIDFELANQSNVALDIFDICGRKVANIAKGVYGPGKYTVSWDATGFPSGVYFVRLNDGSKTIVKTATYLK